MHRYSFFILTIATAAGIAVAQDTLASESATVQTEAVSAETVAPEPSETAQPVDGLAETEAFTQENVADLTSKRSGEVPIAPLTISAAVDMQVDKEMYDEFSTKGTNRFRLPNLQRSYRNVADDFWMRVAVKMSYSLKNFESGLALRFYPYWTMRRKDNDNQLGDMEPYLELFEVNQAFLKAFKEYTFGDENTVRIHFKVGRDGLLNSCSQLFGNYLDLPTAGYGDSKNASVVGPFKNRKIFANQLEVGGTFKIGDFIAGRTSLMLGGNVNNEKWYTAPDPKIFQVMDSKLSAGFVRGYQDFYFLGNKVHFGSGFRIYTTKVDKTEPVDSTTTTTFVDNSEYVFGDWTFDIAPLTDIPELKFYSEFAYQRLGVGSSTGIVRPFNVGITLPTAHIVDTLAVEFENVANIFLSDKSMRDKIGDRATRSGAWGMVVEKHYLDRIIIAWGLYTANPSGDMKTSLRLTSNF